MIKVIMCQGDVFVVVAIHRYSGNTSFPTRMTYSSEAEDLVQTIIASPSIMNRIKSGMEVKEAVLEELNVWASFCAKTDRSTEAGRALDNVAREVIFNRLCKSYSPSAK